MQRVLVLGSPGAGKSTFARALGVRTGLPVIHLDQLYWQDGWTEAENHVFRARLDHALAQPEWIMDGNFRSTLTHRLIFADTVVVMEIGRMRCIANLLRRVWRYRGQVRPDMSQGCPERLDYELLRFIWAYPRRYQPQVSEALACYKGQITRIGSRREAEAWLQAQGKAIAQD